MKRYSVYLLLSLAGVFGLASIDSAQGQPPSPRYSTSRPFPPASGISPAGRPSFSPYLNLLRRGSPALNYYGIIRPELEFRRNNTQFRRDFQQLRSRPALIQLPQEQPVSNLGQTGHAVQFRQDLRGGRGTLSGNIRNRQAGLQNLRRSPTSLLPPTGHTAVFGNRSFYYPR